MDDLTISTRPIVSDWITGSKDTSEDSFTSASGAHAFAGKIRNANSGYSVPPLYASQKLTLKVEPIQLYIFHNEKLIATHLRCYDRRQNRTNPDHTQELLTQRKKAHDQTLLLTFLNLSPAAELFCRKLQDKRLNALHHIQKIVALSEIYGPDKVARAIEDAITFEAFGCEYVANILTQRERVCGPPGALHLTRHQDLLDLDLPAADLDLYERKQHNSSHHS